jgi:dienelactone hydrolase
MIQMSLFLKYRNLFGSFLVLGGVLTYAYSQLNGAPSEQETSANNRNLASSARSEPAPEVVTIPNGALELKGVLYRPHGKGPFPAVLYNHGSAPGMLNAQAAELLGPLYVKHGWVFFMPYRRGQGLSQNAGPYIMDEVAAAQKQGGMEAAAHRMTELLKTDHLNDQVAALTWLKQQPDVDLSRIATAGNSFGGILTVLSAAKNTYCAAINASGAAQSWSDAPAIQELMIEAVKKSNAPIFFFQAENDFDLSPSRVLSTAMKALGKSFGVKFYPPYGNSPKEGHSFAYLGASIWEKDVFDFLDQHCGSK